MSEKCFLSIDWDYFIMVHKARSNSYRETMDDILIKWYREYLLGIEHDMRLEKDFELGSAYQTFYEQIMPYLSFDKTCELVLSESHANAYEEVINVGADTVYLFDAHSDLGYGGLEALNYEVNCANWLGMLLKEGRIKKAYIIYSPYTKEHEEEFAQITAAYQAEFIDLDTFLQKKLQFAGIHICRSGPWTPPWYDQDFYEFAKAFKLPIRDHTGGKRDWHPEALSLAERINYRLGVI